MNKDNYQEIQPYQNFTFLYNKKKVGGGHSLRSKELMKSLEKTLKLAYKSEEDDNRLFNKEETQIL